MMRTTPWRRTTLHLSQRLLTEAWTFICLPETISNPAPGQVIGRQFHQYLVSGEDPDKVHPDFAGRMGQNSVPICQFYTKHRVWQIFFYRAFNLNRLFFRHSAVVSITSRIRPSKKNILLNTESWGNGYQK